MKTFLWAPAQPNQSRKVMPVHQRKQGKYQENRRDFSPWGLSRTQDLLGQGQEEWVGGYPVCGSKRLQVATAVWDPGGHPRKDPRCCIPMASSKGSDASIPNCLPWRGVQLCNQKAVKACRPVVVQLLSRVQICNPVDCSMPGFPVLHCLLEFAQTLVRWVGDAIEPSHSLSPSSPALSLSQHQDLFQWVDSVSEDQSIRVTYIQDCFIKPHTSSHPKWTPSLPWIMLSLSLASNAMSGLMYKH